MILLDVNLLIHATRAEAQQHERARDWLDAQLSRPERVGLPWVTVLGFLRLATNARVFQQPLSMAVAWKQVRLWLAADPVWIPQPAERHAQILGELLGLPGVHGNLVPDVHLAALAIEHGLTLCSTDGDFARFPGLRLLNPLAP